jgi:ubiquinone biosynthesis protein Coq4
MDTRRGFFSGRVARTLLGLNNFIILASSIINTAIMAYFIHWNYRRTHDIYNIVIVRSSSLSPTVPI